MSQAELMREVFISLENLSDIDIITEFGIEYLNFKIDAQKAIWKLRLSRIYISIGNSHIGMN